MSLNIQTSFLEPDSGFIDKHDKILGLSVILDFVTVNEAALLLDAIDSENWLNDLSRRVQHYGYKYDYKARRIDVSMKIGELPHWVVPIAEQLTKLSFFENRPNQVIVNEYEPGQGIAPHIDCEPCFDDTIASLSLGSGATMNFDKDGETVPIYLPSRSLVVLKKESRYDWKHSIPKRKSDMVNGEKCSRSRRISLTFRRVII